MEAIGNLLFVYGFIMFMITFIIHGVLTIIDTRHTLTIMKVNFAGTLTGACMILTGFVIVLLEWGVLTRL